MLFRLFGRAGARPSLAALGLVVLATVAPAAPASAVRLMCHNLLNWSGSSGVARVPYMRAIVRGVGPDLVVVQEMIDQAGVDLYRDQVLNFREPGQWASATFTNGPDTDNALFYRTSRIEVLGAVEVPTTLRNASRYHLRLVGYTGSGAEFYLYSFHLKSSTGSTNEQQRLSEMQVFRANAESLPPGSLILFAGDYNVYSGNEPAFQHALASIGQNIGRMKDPINRVGAWSSNTAFADVHTQSPRNTSFGGGATGGMDDRFDFILTSYNWSDGQGFELLAPTYTAYGNDGQHCCNSALDGPLSSNPTGPPANLAVGVAQADSIKQASDHLPVFADLSVPSRLGLPIAFHDFGTVIVGAVAGFDLPVQNTAAVPGDALDYSFDPAVVFDVPAGPFSLAPGAAANHAIGMPTATPGARDEMIGLSTDAPGSASVTVALTGLVVGHAQPSADSALVVLADTLDFGSEESGGFSDRTAAVWNTGFGALQAPLRVAGAAIAGGDGRFALVEPFAAQLVGAAPATFDVAFDDAGATAESTYTATLTFETADDPALPGATARPSVAYTLKARLSNPLVDAGEAGAPPARTLLLAPTPNPVTAARAALRFDLAKAGRVRLAVFDVRGRHVATLLDGERAAGRHAASWDGREAYGRPAGNGVYFARLVAADGTVSSRRFVLMR